MLSLSLLSVSFVLDNFINYWKEAVSFSVHRPNWMCVCVCVTDGSFHSVGNTN